MARDLSKLTYAELDVELAKCALQLKAIHDLPDIPAANLEVRALFGNGNKALKPSEYMEDALNGVRARCIEIHWRKIRYLQRWQAHLRKYPAATMTLQQLSGLDL